MLRKIPIILLIITFFSCDDIEKFQVSVAESRGYEIVDHTMVLYVKPKKK